LLLFILKPDRDAAAAVKRSFRAVTMAIRGGTELLPPFQG
jgi:hypothetical protein